MGKKQKNGRRVLVVDDDPHICDLFQLIFSFRGFEVDGAGTAARASELLQQQHFDAVTLDMHLPDADGVELARDIRAAYPNIGIVILSGDHPRNELPDAVVFLSKPTELEKLVAVLERISGAEEST